MTQLYNCIACQFGDHANHTPVIRPGTPGLIGSRAECPCKGECQLSGKERLRRFTERLLGDKP